MLTRIIGSEDLCIAWLEVLLPRGLDINDGVALRGVAIGRADKRLAHVVVRSGVCLHTGGHCKSDQEEMEMGLWGRMKGKTVGCRRWW